MNGLALLAAASFIYFTYHIIDQGLCEATQPAGLQRDPNNRLRYARFMEHLYHVLDVPKIELVAVQTGRNCLLRCVKNDRCFSANVGAFHLPNGNVSCELLPTDKYNASEKFKANHTFHHYSILSPCESFPCQHGGSCRALYETDDYNCTCTVNYTGRNCEKKRIYRSCNDLYMAGQRSSGTYRLSLSGTLFQVYCDMSANAGGWTLIARFSNADGKNWMRDDAYWWYDEHSSQGSPTNTSSNYDMISEAFGRVRGNEMKITRSDNSSHTALLRTYANCLSGNTFRGFLSSYGRFNYRNVWPDNQCLGSCAVYYGGLYKSTAGFERAHCSGDIQSSNYIGFWCRYQGDGSVMMFGGGGTKCGRADHGIGLTENDYAGFEEWQGLGESDFGDNADSSQTASYSLNLWIR